MASMFGPTVAKGSGKPEVGEGGFRSEAAEVSDLGLECLPGTVMSPAQSGDVIYDI